MNKTKKYRFINKIKNLSKKEKISIINFFTKYPQYEKHIDWNRSQSLRYQDFEQVFKISENSKNRTKQNTKNNPRLLFEKYNCEIITHTDDFLLIVPNDWKCAVFFNSFNCGGEGAQWCIGDKNNTYSWYYHIKEADDIFALVFFIKKHPLFGKKILLQYDMEYNDFVFWCQDDIPFSIPYNSEFSDLLYSMESGTSLPWKILPHIWYLQLLFERKNKKQLFFEFDIFPGISRTEFIILNKIILTLLPKIAHSIVAKPLDQ